MQCTSTIACHLERARGLEDLKRGIRGRPRNSSPLVSLLNKRIYKFKSRDLKSRNLLFSNFKIPFTRKNWLLKFGFAYHLAQILEPKLLVHEILKFARLSITQTACSAKRWSVHLERAMGLRDLKGDKGDSFASQARNCKQTVTRVPLSPFWIKRIYKFNKAVFANFKIPFTRKSWLLIFVWYFHKIKKNLHISFRLFSFDFIKFSISPCYWFKRFYAVT